MKRCLLISAYFPPVGGIGVQRITKFVKYLPAAGWKPTVITTPVWSLKMRRDTTLLNELAPETEIYRPFYYDSRKIIPGDVAKLFQPLERRFLFPDKLKIWNHFVLKWLKEKIQDVTPDLILINLPPFSGLHLCQKIKKTVDIPVLLNFRDAFSFNNYYKLHKQQCQMKHASQIERDAFEAADGIIFVTPYMLRTYDRLFPEFREKFHLITNGYDEADFQEIDNIQSDQNSIFTIGYNGSYSKLVPITPLIRAICTIFETKQIRMQLYIATKNPIKELRTKFPKLFEQDLANYQGFLPHRESLLNLAKSNILTLMFANHPATEGAYSGKIFEYLRMQKPVLLLHKQNSDIAGLISETQSGMTVNIDSQEEIMRGLLHYYQLWEKNRLHHEPDIEKIKTMDYRNLTASLTQLFDKTIGPTR